MSQNISRMPRLKNQHFSSLQAEADGLQIVPLNPEHIDALVKLDEELLNSYPPRQYLEKELKLLSERPDYCIHLTALLPHFTQFTSSTNSVGSTSSAGSTSPTGSTSPANSTSPSSHQHAADHAGRYLLHPVGHIGMKIADREASIEVLAVSQKQQNKKIATHLILKACKKAIAGGAESMGLEVRAQNRKALKLYGKFGMAPVGIRKDYYPAVTIDNGLDNGLGKNFKPSEDAILMWNLEIQSAEFSRRIVEIEAGLNRRQGTISGKE